MNYSLNDNRSELELFHCGDSVHAYNFFGAHLANEDGKDGVVFRVWAPNAADTAVVLSYDTQNSQVLSLKNIGGGVWQIFVPDAHEGAVYYYRITDQNGEILTRSDSFAFYSKPDDITLSVVHNIDSYIWCDEQWLENRKNKDTFSNPMNVYEVDLATWRRNPDGTVLSYRELANQLIDYLKYMHYTHIQLMPVGECTPDSSKYLTDGYFSASSRYGFPEDLMYLVDRLHGENIGVIMGFIPLCFSKDSSRLAKFDGGFVFENENPLLGYRSEWDTCLFDFTKPEVVSFLISSAVFWFEKFHLDGIKIGALSSMLLYDYGKKDGQWQANKFGGKENLEAVDFIKRFNTAVHLHFPDVITIAEENTSWIKLTRAIQEGGLGFDYKWNVGWMNDVLNYMSLDPNWRPFNHDNLTYSFFYAFSEHFILPISHNVVSKDIGSLVSRMPGDYEEKLAGVRAFIAYMYAHPGKKLIFMGTELGIQSEWEINKYINWHKFDSDEKRRQLQQFFKDINSFYLESRPLYEIDSSWKGFDWIHHDDYFNSVIAFKRTDSTGSEIIAVCNFQPKRLDNYNIGVPKYGLYDEVFSSDNELYGGSGITNGINLMPEKIKIHGCNQGLTLTLPPLSVIFLKCSRLL